ncbi:MAG TPA: hypothetical protein VFO36_04290 [Nitrospiraceae bacterium]|nr:hypothetical protein [Nitrospiraceae bacterium]
MQGQVDISRQTTLGVLNAAIVAGASHVGRAFDVATHEEDRRHLDRAARRG